jgi:subtilase family serine protease
VKAKRNHPVSVGFASIGCASVLWLVTLSSPAQQTLQVLHDHVRPAVSSGQAAPAGFLPATQHMNFSIMLPLRNQAELTRLLGRLYDPSSRDYRHFLSVAEFTEEFGPTVEDYQAVVDFARTNGLTVTDTPANRMIVPIDGTVAQIENALHVSMRVYQHPTEKRTFYSPDREPSLALSVPVWHIEGLNNFSVPRPLLTKAAAEQAIPAVTGSGPGGSYLGSDMRAAYYGGTALTGSGQIVGLWESISYDPNDVNLTFSNTGQSYSVPINNVLLDGITVGDANGDAETVLDIVQAIGMAPGLSQVRVYLGNNQVDIFNAMATENIAKQLSVSYIWEPDNYQTLDPIFEEFVAQGQTLFASSGDNGAYQPSAPQYYPAEDIYVTAAGGTSLLTDGPGGSWTSETAWQQSGGGNGPIPYVITIPVWQEGVATSSNGASTTLRNVPDVALDSDYNNYACEAGSCSGGWGGTSFSAPRWAAFMALVNEQAAAQGNPPLGFIDPALYSIGLGSNYDSDFHDITSGNNDCCGQTVAYSAVPGYDLVTGWGSPNGQALINALAGGFTLSASPGSLTVTQGSSGTTTITVADEGGFTGSVNLAVSGLPSGVTASFGANPAAESAVLTLTASSSATPGTVTITIIGTYSSLTESTTLPLTINPSSSTFTVEASPTSLYLTQGKRSVSRITVTGVGAFRSAVQLSATGLPRGVSARFSRPSVTPRGNDRATSILQFIASSKATTGAATVTVTGSSNSISASANITINLEKKRMGNVEQHWERHPPLGR